MNVFKNKKNVGKIKNVKTFFYIYVLAQVVHFTHNIVCLCQQPVSLCAICASQNILRLLESLKQTYRLKPLSEKHQQASSIHRPAIVGIREHGILHNQFQWIEILYNQQYLQRIDFVLLLYAVCRSAQSIDCADLHLRVLTIDKLRNNRLSRSLSIVRMRKWRSAQLIKCADRQNAHNIIITSGQRGPRR